MVVQRRRAAEVHGGDEEGMRDISPEHRSNLASLPTELTSSISDDKIAVDEFGFTDDESSQTQFKLTLMEEVLLLGLKDEQGYLSFWNDNISFVLRGCILMELSMRNRIQCLKEAAGRHHRKPAWDRYIEVVDDTLTGEILLDEALKMMKTSAAAATIRIGTSSASDVAGKHTISEWIDLLSGETWNPFKFSYQLKQVRERLAKGLVDKGVLRTERKNFLVFDMPTHPVSDPTAKQQIIQRVCDCLVSRGPGITRRTLALTCAAYSANVLSNALAQTTISLTHSQKDACYSKCEELLAEWCTSSSGVSVDNTKSSAPKSTLLNRYQCGWNDVMSGVLGVYLKMDNVL